MHNRVGVMGCLVFSCGIYGSAFIRRVVIFCCVVLLALIACLPFFRLFVGLFFKVSCFDFCLMIIAVLVA